MRAVVFAWTDITDFILRTALRKAQQMIDEHERLSLSRRDSRRVMQLPENPPAPNARLRKAARVAEVVMSLPAWHEEPMHRTQDRLCLGPETVGNHQRVGQPSQWLERRRKQ